MFRDPNAFLVRLAFLLPAAVVSIVIHEMAHAYAAVARGDGMPRFQGRLSPDPRRHLEPLGLVMVALVGVGFGKPVPTNPARLNTTLSRVLVALAGPAANLLLAGLVSIPLRLLTSGLAANAHAQQLPCSLGMAPQDLLLAELFYFYGLNLLLVVFNLLPFPGLDGFELLRTWLRRVNPRLLFQVESNRQGLVIALLFVFLIFPGILAGVLSAVAGPLGNVLGIQIPQICG